MFIWYGVYANYPSVNGIITNTNSDVIGYPSDAELKRFKELKGYDTDQYELDKIKQEINKDKEEIEKLREEKDNEREEEEEEEIDEEDAGDDDSHILGQNDDAPNVSSSIGSNQDKEIDEEDAGDDDDKDDKDEAGGDDDPDETTNIFKEINKSIENERKEEIKENIEENEENGNINFNFDDGIIKLPGNNEIYVGIEEDNSGNGAIIVNFGPKAVVLEGMDGSGGISRIEWNHEDNPEVLKANIHVLSKPTTFGGQQIIGHYHLDSRFILLTNIYYIKPDNNNENEDDETITDNNNENEDDETITDNNNNNEEMDKELVNFIEDEDGIDEGEEADDDEDIKLVD